MGACMREGKRGMQMPLCLQPPWRHPPWMVMRPPAMGGSEEANTSKSPDACPPACSQQVRLLADTSIIRLDGLNLAELPPQLLGKG